MRRILEEWPARKIMTDFEKDWNEKRLSFLSRNPPLAAEYFRDQGTEEK